jgi:hypothetical protein
MESTPDNKFFVEPNFVYHFIEDNWGLRLSGAEKMWVNTYMVGSWDSSDTFYSLSCVLDFIGFDSNKFRALKKSIAKTQRDITEVFEMRESKK